MSQLSTNVVVRYRDGKDHYGDPKYATCPFWMALQKATESEHIDDAVELQAKQFRALLTLLVDKGLISPQEALDVVDQKPDGMTVDGESR